MERRLPVQLQRTDVDQIIGLRRAQVPLRLGASLRVVARRDGRAFRAAQAARRLPTPEDFRPVLLKQLIPHRSGDEGLQKPPPLAAIDLEWQRR